MRAALYARYSSDLQRDASIADQLRLLRERAARDGLEVVAEFSDAAISGSSLVARPGLQQLVAAARAGRVDVVLAEALDRLSRDQEDIAGLFKRLRHAGARIVTLAEGDVDELHIGLKGTMNALFVRDLAAKVRRGQRGRVEAGRIPGGLTYGYVRVLELRNDEVAPRGAGRSDVERGRRAIDAARAAVVRRIFADYVAGVSPRAIAASLNRERVPSPRGGQWNASTINGSRTRRNGILHNELYAGRIVYNRQAFVKDPDTGRRQARPNPRAQWISVDVPELAIVDAETWRQAQAAKAQRSTSSPAAALRQRRPKRLLSGLVACGRCGGGYSVLTRRMGCTARREKGTCDNERTIDAEKLERRVLAGLKERLLAPDLVAIFVREVAAEQARRRALAGETQRQAARQRAELERRIARLVDAIADGTDTPATRQRLVEAERTKAELEAAQAPAELPPIVLHPNLAELYRRKVGELEAAIAADAPAGRAQAFATLRGMIDGIVIHPGGNRGEVKIELRGQLAGILAAMQERNEKGALTGALRDRRLVGNDGCGRGIATLPAFPPLVVFV